VDDQTHAGQDRIFLLPPFFAMAGKQNCNPSLGAGDDAVRLGWTLLFSSKR
jgi:hypothetical protein